jgi:transposase-like protein
MVTNTTPSTTELVETGEVRDRVGRTITPRARRAELVAAWRQSGRTQAAFAKAEGVNYTTFCAWVQQQSRAGGERPPAMRSVKQSSLPPMRFAEVSVPGTSLASAASLEVRLADGTMIRGEKVADVVQLLKALRSA